MCALLERDSFPPNPGAGGGSHRLLPIGSHSPSLAYPSAGYEELDVNRVKRVLRNHRPAGSALFIFWLGSIELVQITANEVDNALGTAHTEPLYTQKYAKSYQTRKDDTKRPPLVLPLLLFNTGPLIAAHGPL